MLYRIGKVLFYLYFVIFYRVKVEGKDNIPSSGPLLLYANHPSAWDMFFIAVFLKRRIHYMAKVELFRNRFLAFILRSLGAFPVSRGKGDVGSVKTVFRLLNQGKIVGLFPEGTRTPKKDPSKRKAGAAMLALHSNAPILPVGVVWSPKKFSTIKLVFGKPFTLPKSTGKPSKEELISATKEIIDRIYALIGQ